MSASRFVWHDLMAADVEAAKRFYSELFHWRFMRGEHDPYEHIQSGEQHIGGMMKLDPKHGVPPHWMGYVSVDNVDACLERVTKHGGRIAAPKMSAGEAGEFGIAVDPQGAVFAAFHYTGKEAERPESHEAPAPSTFCWDELLTSDPDAAAKFYSHVFGWTAEHLEMPGFGRYTLLKRAGVKDAKGQDKSAAGVMKLPPSVPHSFWLPYVAVANTDATAEHAKRLGAMVPMPPMNVQGVGRFTTILDPQHAVIAVLANA